MIRDARMMHDRGSLTFDSFFRTHVLNQNGNYQYQWGQNIGATPPRAQSAAPHPLIYIYIAPQRSRCATSIVQPRASSAYGLFPYNP